MSAWQLACRLTRMFWESPTHACVRANSWLMSLPPVPPPTSCVLWCCVPFPAQRCCRVPWCKSTVSQSTVLRIQRLPISAHRVLHRQAGSASSSSRSGRCGASRAGYGASLAPAVRTARHYLIRFAHGTPNSRPSRPFWTAEGGGGGAEYWQKRKRAKGTPPPAAPSMPHRAPTHLWSTPRAGAACACTLEKAAQQTRSTGPKWRLWPSASKLHRLPHRPLPLLPPCKHEVSPSARSAASGLPPGGWPGQRPSDGPHHCPQRHQPRRTGARHHVPLPAGITSPFALPPRPLAPAAAAADAACPPFVAAGAGAQRRRSGGAAGAREDRLGMGGRRRPHRRPDPCGAAAAPRSAAIAAAALPLCLRPRAAPPRRGGHT